MTTDRTVTSSTGTSVTLTWEGLIILDNPDAPDDMRYQEAGRMIDGGFQPAFFAPWALRPEILRIIAELVEESSF